MKFALPGGEIDIEIDGYEISGWQHSRDRNVIGFHRWRAVLTPWRQSLKLSIKPKPALYQLYAEIKIKDELLKRFNAAKISGITHDQYLSDCMAIFAEYAADFLAGKSDEQRSDAI